MWTKRLIRAVNDAFPLLAIGVPAFALGLVAYPGVPGVLVVTVLAAAATGAVLRERATAHEIAIYASLRPAVMTEPGTPRRGSAGTEVLRSNEWHC